MQLYNYNKNLVDSLGYTDILEKNNFFNEKYNRALLYFVTSFDEHIKSINKNDKVIAILKGDYFSFEYYANLLPEFDKIYQLTMLAKHRYAILLKEEVTKAEIYDFIVSPLRLLCKFYEMSLSQADEVLLIKHFLSYYQYFLADLFGSQYRNLKWEDLCF